MQSPNLAHNYHWTFMDPCWHMAEGENRKITTNVIPKLGEILLPPAPALKGSFRVGKNGSRSTKREWGIEVSVNTTMITLLPIL